VRSKGKVVAAGYGITIQKHDLHTDLGPALCIP
jgi:hypothetical protein